MNDSVFLPLELDDGSTLYVQTMRVRDGGVRPASADRQVNNAAECMEKAMPAVVKFAGGLKERFALLSPDEIEPEFSVGFTGELSAVIGSAGAEGGISVHLVWKNGEEKDA